jgi:hypothetical protein
MLANEPNPSIYIYLSDCLSVFLSFCPSVRFGEESLHSCEVMLHDLEVSRRVNSVVSSELRQRAAKAGLREVRLMALPSYLHVVCH